MCNLEKTSEVSRSSHSLFSLTAGWNVLPSNTSDFLFMVAFQSFCCNGIVNDFQFRRLLFAGNKTFLLDAVVFDNQTTRHFTVNASLLSPLPFILTLLTLRMPVTQVRGSMECSLSKEESRISISASYGLYLRNS